MAFHYLWSSLLILTMQIFALLLGFLLPVMTLLRLIPKYLDGFFKGLMDVIHFQSGISFSNLRD